MRNPTNSCTQEQLMSRSKEPRTSTLATLRSGHLLQPILLALAVALAGFAHAEQAANSADESALPDSGGIENLPPPEDLPEGEDPNQNLPVDQDEALEAVSDEELQRLEAEAQAANEIPPDVPPEVAEKADAFQGCVNEIMATLSNAAEKRLDIAENCASQRAELIESFPAELRQLVAANTDNRVEGVLASLEDIEGVAIESATDVNEIAADLEAVEAQNIADEAAAQDADSSDVVDGGSQAPTSDG